MRGDRPGRRLAGRAAPAAGCSSCSARFGSSTTSAAACSVPSPALRSAGPSARLLYFPRQTELRHYAQDSAILSRLNQELPPHRLIDTLSQIDPFAHSCRPGRRSGAAGSGRARLARREQCGTERRARGRQRLRARDPGLGRDRGQRARRHQRPRRCRCRRAPTSTATTARCSTRRSSCSTRPTTSPCSGCRTEAPPLKLGDAASGTHRRAARLPGQRSVRRDGRPHRPHRADRRPRCVRQVPGQPQGDDDPRRRSAAATLAVRSSMAQGRVITTVFAQRVGTDGGTASQTARSGPLLRRPARTIRRLPPAPTARATRRARPRAA